MDTRRNRVPRGPRQLQCPSTCLVVVLALGAATARAQDPEGCFQSASPALSIEAFRMDGQIGLIGNVSECETIAYRVKLAHTAPETGCAIGKGTITLATPDGVPHLVSADVPCIGGHGDNGSGCDPNQGYAFTSGLVPYKVQPRDVVDGFIEASAKYTDGVLFDAKTPTPGVGASTGAKEPVVFCADENLCTSDSCQPTKYGAEACINEPIVCDDGNGCTSDQCNPADGHCVFELAVFCDDGSVCSNDACDPDTGQCVYQPVLANVPCRPSAGICDVAETCTGDSVDCPADGVRDGTFVCRAASGACDVAEACTGAAAACPADGGLPDTDGDALCDAIDPCTNVGGGRTLSGVNPIPKIIINKINTDTVPGNDHVTLTGAFILPASARFSDLNPQAHGARVVLRNRFGVSELDVTLPGGVFNGAGTRGWKLTNVGKTWTYTDSTASPIGAIVTVNLYDRNTQIPNRVEIRVVGDDGTYPVVAGDEPIDGILAIGGPAQAAAGLCGETAFLPADCFYNLSGNQLTCRP